MKKTAILVFITCSVFVSLFCAHSEGAQTPRVKNVIIMISDGCGFNQIEAAGLYKNGKKGGFIFESFPVRCAMSTYSACQGYYPNDIWSSFSDIFTRGGIYSK